MSTAVYLYIYDLSGGLARTMSLQLLGKHIQGIWHTSVVVFGTEYYFGQGIYQCEPGRSPFGTPLEQKLMGHTQVDSATFSEFLVEMGTNFGAFDYHLLDKNCNHFTYEVVKFLTGIETPEYIRSLPAEVMSTAFGATFRPLIERMYGASSLPRPMAQPVAQPLAKPLVQPVIQSVVQPVVYPLEPKSLETVLAERVETEEERKTQMQSLCNSLSDPKQVERLLLLRDEFQRVLQLLADGKVDSEASAGCYFNMSLGIQEIYNESYMDAAIELLCLGIQGRLSSNKHVQRGVSFLTGVDSALEDLAKSLEQ